MKNALDEMEYIEDELILEAEEYRKKKIHGKWGAVAAMLCVCMLGAMLLVQRPQKPMDTGSTPEMPDTVEEPAPDYGVDSDNIIRYYEGDWEIRDLAVNNGCCELSEALKFALNENGAELRYSVTVEVFRDGTVEESYDAVMEAEALRNFPVSDEVGYYISFYDEYHGMGETTDTPAQVADAEDPDEIHVIYQTICNDLAAGELPKNAVE